MYYRLDWKSGSGDDFANTADSPDTDVCWTMGELHNERAEPVPQPLICNLHPKRGKTLRDVFLVDIPLFSNRMLKVLADNGIDNLQLFDAALKAPDGTLYTGYKAVNIIGLVSCADMEHSTYMPGTEVPLVEFQNLVINESRASDLPLFRLAENSLYILVSERIKMAIEAAHLVGFSLIPVQSSL